MTTDYHHPISYGAPVDSRVVNGPLGELDEGIKDLDTRMDAAETDIQGLILGTESLIQLNYASPTTLEIDAGRISVSRSYHLVETQGSASADDLTHIDGGQIGDHLRISIVDSARVVTIKHNQGGAGNIYLSHEGDLVMDSDSKHVDLFFDGTSWIQSMSAIRVKDQRASTLYPADRLVVPPGVIRSTAVGNNARMLDMIPGAYSRNFWGERAAAATYAPFGIASGTSTGAGVLAEANDDNTTYVAQPVAATGGTFGGRRSSTFDLTRRSHNPYAVFVIKTGSSITNVRYWIGLFSAAVTNVDDIAGATEAAAFRYSSVAADPAWMAVTKDATTQATAVSTGVGVATDTQYKFELYIDDTAGIAYFSVNGSVEVTQSVNLPAASTELGWVATLITTTNTAKTFNFSRMMCHHD